LDRNVNIYTVPGLYGSGPEHWQTHWEKLYGYIRIKQADWDNPDYNKWAYNLSETVVSSGKQSVILVAHSLGCHLVAKSYSRLKPLIKGIFFVAPPDLDADVLKKNLSGFKAVPVIFECPSWLVYSENDPFASVQYSETMGSSYGMKCINIGMKGHINSDSNIGNWDEGYRLFNQMLKEVGL
jgi:predicted alpha/beta hydrolase family esterase